MENFDLLNLATLTMTAGVLLSLGIVEWATRHYRKTTSKYAGLVTHCSLPGRSVAQRLLKRLGIEDVTVHRKALKNVYLPWRRRIQLTDATYNSPTMFSLASAAHEVGHAEQFATGFRAARLWRVVTPVSFVLMAVAIAWSILLISGFVDSLFSTGDLIAPALFGLIVAMQVPVHLPLERDASRRARCYVREEGLVTDEELPVFDELLSAAWKTHLAQNIQRWLIVGVLFVVMGFAPTFLGQPGFPEFDLPENTNIASPDRAPTNIVHQPPVAPTRQEPLPPFPDNPTAPADTMPGPEDGLISVSLTDCLKLMFSDLSSILGLATIAGFVYLAFRLPQSFKHQPSSEELALQHNNQASAQQLKGHSEAAIGEFSRCLELNPEFTIAWSNRGQAYLSLGRFEDAVSDFNRALELAPQFADALGGRAWLRACMGDFASAMADCDSALETNPDNGDLWAVRGTVNRGLENYAEAIVDYSKALEFGSTNAANYRDRGLARLRTGDFEAALEDTRHALRIDPEDAIALNNCGAILIKTGNFNDAMDVLQASLKLQPECAWPLRHRAWIRATCPDDSTRNGMQAIADATRALELTDWQQREWLETLAAAHAEAGDFDEACRFQEKWLETAPPSHIAESLSRLELYQSQRPYRDDVH